MEEVTKCRYIDCVDTREKEQILHELPVCDTGLCVRWLINSGHVDLIGRDLDALRSMKFFVCNNHFTDDCYLSKGTLKENAVPFPHWSAVSKTLKTLKTRRKVQVNGQGSSMEEESINQAAEKNAPSEFDVDQWCRTCATKKQNLVSMTSKGKGTDMSLLSKLKLLIEIDDEDALPTNMCDECVDKLERSFKFFQQIYVADNTLRHVFPNSRSNSMPKKPLYSLSEHMRKEQKEKEQGEKETAKEKEEEKEKEKEEEQQNRAPRITRGIFRRGRGRPRSRGFGGRGRGRQRSAQVAASIQNRNPSPSRNVNVNVNVNVSRNRNRNRNRNPSPGIGNDTAAGSVNTSRTNEYENVRNEHEMEINEDAAQGDTVFSLLTDTCRSDEELDWSDVLKVMSDQRYRPSSGKEENARKLETRLDEKVEKIVESKMVVDRMGETKIETKVNVVEMIPTESETTSTLKAEIMETEVEAEVEAAAAAVETTEWSEASTDERRKVKVETEGRTEEVTLSVEAAQATEKEEEEEEEEEEDVEEEDKEEHKRKMVIEGKETEQIRCEFCEEEFKFRRQLHTHLSTVHSELSKHMCIDCLTCCESESLLSKHRGLCHGERRYRCEHCQEEFLEKRILKEHVRKCEPYDRSRYSCDSCGVTLAGKEDLTEHVKNHRNSESDGPKNVDQATLSASESRRMEEKGGEGQANIGTTSDTISTLKPNPEKTEEVASSSDRLEGGDNAMEQVPEGDEGSIVCPDCNEQMQNTMELGVHRMRRHSVNRKDTTCLLCDNKSFCSSEEYEQHVLDHCKRLRISPR